MKLTRTARTARTVLAAALLAVLTASAAACASTPGTAPGGTPMTVPTTTTLPAAGPDETAALQALLDAAPVGATVSVDRPVTVDGTVTVPRALNVVFGPQGMLRRVDPAAGVRVRPVLVVAAAASGSRFTDLRIVGPHTCDFQWPAGKSSFIATYDPTVEAQHGVDVRGAADVTFTRPAVSGVSGDGFNLVGNARNVTIDQATVSCVGRNAISNTGSSNTLVNGGTFSGVGLWVFNIEPFGTNVVDGYAVVAPRVGMSGWPWLMATGPNFNCQVRNVLVTGADTSGAYPVAPTVDACAQVTFTAAS